MMAIITGVNLDITGVVNHCRSEETHDDELENCLHETVVAELNRTLSLVVATAI